MDFSRFTEKLQDAVRDAQSLAVRNGNQQIDVEHLLLALLDQEGGLAPSILNKADIRVDAMRTRIQQEIDKFPKVTGPAAGPGQESRNSAARTAHAHDVKPRLIAPSSQRLSFFQRPHGGFAPPEPGRSDSAGRGLGTQWRPQMR